MRFLGAKVVLTPAAEKGSGMLAQGRRAGRDARLVPVPPVRERGQRRHALAHHRARDPRRLRGRAARLLGHRLRHRRHAEGRRARAEARSGPETQIVVCEPDNSPILGSGIPQPRDADGTPRGSHPRFRPHLMQGWAPGLHPEAHRGRGRRRSWSTEIVPVDGAEALRLSRELAQQEGIFVGISGGATLAGALAGRATRAAGRDHPVHAARHRRALSQHAAVRRTSPPT